MIKLERTGRRPLELEGEEIASASSKGSGGTTESRWFELALYETASKRMVLSIVYNTQWQGELDHNLAEEVSGPEEVEAILLGYDPCQFMPAWVDSPGQSQMRDKEARRCTALRRAYETAVSELLSGLPERIE